MTAPRSFYDVIVVGASLAAVGAGALLARRGFRVALIGHGTRPSVYEYEGLRLRRDLAALTIAEVPAFRRVLAELALLPALRRRVHALDPGCQVVLPRHRLDLASNPERLLAEFDREFPELHRPIEDFYAAVERGHQALDRVLGPDIVWPPDGFFERRAAARLAAGLPFGKDGMAGDLFAEFAADHPFRTVIDAQVRFASALDPDRMTALCRTRLLAQSTRAAFLNDGDADGVRKLFEEKILQHGGDVRTRDRVDRILSKNGRVSAVVLSGIDEVLGCAFLVTPLDVGQVVRLTDASPSRAWAQRLLGVRPRYYRYVLNVALHADAVPVGAGPRVFLVADPARPLAEENLLAIETSPPDANRRVVLTACALLPRSGVEEGESYLRRVRPRVMKSLAGFIPFLDRHVIAVDSPHDGLPLEDRVKGTTVTLDARRSGAAEPMEVLETVDPLGFLGVCGIPCRGDLGGLLHVGRQVIPALGAEGEFLAALTAAGLITRTDRSKEKLRRELWSKVEM